MIVIKINSNGVGNRIEWMKCMKLVSELPSKAQIFALIR